jgi:hypothetical protein
MLRYGVKLDFIRPPPTTLQPTPAATPKNPSKATALWTEVQSLLNKQAIQILRDPSSPGFYSHTKSAVLCRLNWNLFQFCIQERTIISFLVPRHIPGKRKILANALSSSSKIVQTEWTLHQEVVNRTCDLWDSPNVDLFATKLNFRLPLYYSPLPDNGEGFQKRLLQ